jgi:hypothetical protein
MYWFQGVDRSRKIAKTINRSGQMQSEAYKPLKVNKILDFFFSMIVICVAKRGIPGMM